jgi:hypothetical protein
MRARLKGLLRKKWFLALLILALIVESSLLIIILVESYLGNQNFPQISIIRYAEPQCATLSATTIAIARSNSTGGYQNRTVEFSCSGNYALKIFPLDTFTCFLCRDPQYFPLVPSFTLPHGYLTLSLTCPVNCLAGQTIPLKSGSTVYMSSWGGYDYIAVLNNTVVGASGFNLSWRNGQYPPPPPPAFKLSASPAQLSIPRGQSATSTITATSLGTFGGRINFTLYVSCDHCGLAPAFVINPGSVFLKPGGTNYTEVTFTTDASVSPATIHYSLYGYGAFVPAGITTIDVVVT